MLHIVLLGPVEARQHATSVPLAPLERTLLALLALADGAVLSTERIIDGLWGSRPPAAPRSRVQGMVSSLRRKIGDAVVTRAPGYFLDLPPEAADLHECERLAAEAASSATPAAAAEALREALALWRGEPLDGVSAPGLDADRARLTELRAALLEDRFEAELRLGRHAELVRELMAAAAADPLRERLTGQLMTALYRSHRQADALRAYQGLRERLAEELGSDPSAELRALHATILRGEAPANRASEPPQAPAQTRPAQMPAPVGHFAGRVADLAALTAALPRSTDEPSVVVVTGAGGLGKTALTVHWAHTVTGSFPDGQIFVDLSGGAGPEAILGAVLLALGVPAGQLPAGAEERAALYRTRMHHRRILVVADGAGAAGQVLPLVPPTPGSLVVATSRSRLTALGAHHATRVLTLQPLGPQESRELLGAIAGPGRLRGDGVAEIVDLCCGWPLALRLAGATLAARSTQSPASFATELRGGVTTLSVGDDPRTVQQSLAAMLTGLDPATVRLFDQLGLHPGRSVCLHLAAATAGVSVLRARRLLDELIDANLVSVTGPDRYGTHAMIRRFARGRALALSDRASVEDRIVRWYLSVLSQVSPQTHPDRRRRHSAAAAEWIPFRGDLEAARFLETEEGDLPAVLAWAATRCTVETTWQLAALMCTVCPALPPAAGRIGLAAAEQLHDPRAVGAARAHLGAQLLRDPLQVDEAAEHLTLAAELLEPEAGRLACTASFGLGSLLARQGRPAEAQVHVERALALLDPSREPLSCAVSLFAYAKVLLLSGSGERGQERFAQSLILAEATLGRWCDGWLHLSKQMGDEFLGYLSEALASPRVAAPDRVLARTLLGLSAGTPHLQQLAVG